MMKNKIVRVYHYRIYKLKQNLKSLKDKGLVMFLKEFLFFIKNNLAHRVKKSKLYFVDPNKIRYRLKNPDDKFYIENGDWDLDREKFEINQTVKDLFVLEIPYQKTEQYKKMKKAMKDKEYNKSYWCENEKDIEDYFQRLIRAYKSIKKGGYKTQKQLKKENKKNKYQKTDEIRLAIDRKGKFLHYSGGDHRLSIAKLLNIKEIPARIVKIHYNFFKNSL